MNAPVIAFYFNKGGVGKTSLVYHVSWMLSEMGRRTLAVDLDPQANLTAAFLSEDAQAELWEAPPEQASTLHRSIAPLSRGVGDIRPTTPVTITDSLALLPGDLALLGLEEGLASQWTLALAGHDVFRPFRMLTAFWQLAQWAAHEVQAEVVLVDTGASLGALTRSALIACDFVVVPLAGDQGSIQGLRNLGPVLRSWREGWARRVADYGGPEMELPAGNMRPIGYTVQQHEMRLDRPVRPYMRWLERIPGEYRRNVLGEPSVDGPDVAHDPECLAMIKHFRSLMPMAQEARRPVFLLKPAHGALGAHAAAVQVAYRDYRALAQKILTRIGLAP